MTSDYHYPRKLSQALEGLRKQNQLCDIIINVGGRAFHAHKAVLAAASSYFLAMFTSGFKESTASEISINGKAKIFEILLEFAYTGELKIASETAYDVLEMACYMQFTNIYKTYCEFIEKELHSTSIPMGDVFKIAQLAKNHKGLKERLVEMSLKNMEKNIQELKGTDEFLQNASMDFLEVFLCREDLSNVEEEKQVLEMVVRWLKYDWENRRNHSLCLLEKVRLGLVPAKDLRELIDSEIQKVPECKALFNGVRRLQSSKQATTSLSVTHPNLYATRSTVTLPLFSTSGVYETGESMCHFEYYLPRDNMWIELGKFPSLPPDVSKFHSLITVQRKLYVVGGCQEQVSSDFDLWNDISVRDQDPPVCAKKFFRYHDEKQKWIKLPSMKKARQKLSLVFLDGFIYAIAGTNQADDLMSDVERYDMAKKEWQVLASLPDGYRWVSAVAYRGKILVYGVSTVRTSNDSQRSCEHLIQVYHPDTNMWQTGLSEEQETAPTSSLPALFIHRDVCYRVVYRTTEDISERSYWSRFKPDKALVNILDFQSQDDETTVTVCDEVNQDLIPLKNGLGAFRINNEVFINGKGFIYKTDLEITPDQNVEVNLGKWSRFRSSNAHCSNITCFTFDRKKLEVEMCSDDESW